MFNKYSYKQKLYALIAIGLLLAIVTYRRAISQTLQVRQNIESVNEQLSKIENADQKKQMIVNELSHIENMIGISGVDNNELQLDLINAVSQHDDIELYQFPTSHNAVNSEVQITTFRITVKGSYWNLMSFIYDLEKEIEKARVVSVSFEKKKSIQTREIELYATIYFQNYEMV